MFEYLLQEASCSVKRQKYKLSTVANALGISKRAIIDLLSREGFKNRASYDQILTAAQVTVLAGVYVRAVRKQFRRLLKESQFDLDKMDVLNQLPYVTAVSDDPFYASDYVFDKDAVEETFYRIISSADRHEKSLSKLYKLVLKALVRVIIVCRGLARDALDAIIPPSLFFTYVDEEDSYITASRK